MNKIEIRNNEVKVANSMLESRSERERLLERAQLQLKSELSKMQSKYNNLSQEFSLYK